MRKVEMSKQTAKAKAAYPWVDERKTRAVMAHRLHMLNEGWNYYYSGGTVSSCSGQKMTALTTSFLKDRNMAVTLVEMKGANASYARSEEAVYRQTTGYLCRCCCLWWLLEQM